jgi:hypothetical protein
MQKHRFIRDARLEKMNANRFYPEGMTYEEAVGIVRRIVRAQMAKAFNTSQESVSLRDQLWRWRQSRESETITSRLLQRPMNQKIEIGS